MPDYDDHGGEPLDERAGRARGKSTHGRILAALRLIFVALLAYVLFVTLKPPIPGYHPSLGGKLINCVALAGLTLAAVVAFPKASLIRIGEMMSFLAALIEALQALPFIGRDANILDWACETAAVILVLVLIPGAKTTRP